MVVENLCTIPLNLPASRVVAGVLAGRPAVLHHHDPPWQRDHFAHVDELPPDDPAWRHVTINDFTRREFAERGIEAITIRNAFDLVQAAGDGATTRVALGVEPDDVLCAHPVRAIERKNVPAAIRLVEAIGGTYWLMGPAEDGYEDTLGRILDQASGRTLHQTPPGSMVDAYAASDLVRVPVDLGGLRQPTDRGGAPPPPSRRRPLPGRRRAAGLGVPLVRSRRPRRRPSLPRGPGSRAAARNRRLAVEHFGLDRLRADVRDLLAEIGDRDGGRPAGRARLPVLTRPSDDPVLAKRARAARLAEAGQRVGYSLFGVAIVAFVVGFAIGFTSTIGAGDRGRPRRRIGRPRTGHRRRLRRQGRRTRRPGALGRPLRSPAEPDGPGTITPS